MGRKAAEEVDVYAFQVEEAVGIEWDLPASRMLVRRWTPHAGSTARERAYP